MLYCSVNVLHFRYGIISVVYSVYIYTQVFYSAEWLLSVLSFSGIVVILAITIGTIMCTQQCNVFEVELILHCWVIK